LAQGSNQDFFVDKASPVSCAVIFFRMPFWSTLAGACCCSKKQNVSEPVYMPFRGHRDDDAALCPPQHTGALPSEPSASSRLSRQPLPTCSQPRAIVNTPEVGSEINLPAAPAAVLEKKKRKPAKGSKCRAALQGAAPAGDAAEPESAISGHCSFSLPRPPQGASRRAQMAAAHAQDITRRRFNNSDADEADMECAVCCQEIAPGDTIWKLPCGHCEWHEVCVHQWLKKHGTCPLCRAPVALPRDPEAADSELDDPKDPKKPAAFAFKSL